MIQSRITEAQTPSLSLSPLQTGPPRTSLLKFWLRRSTWAVNLSICVLLLLMLAVVFAEQVAPHDPNTMNLRARLQAPFDFSSADGEVFLLGTDARGRDVLSRVLYGGQVSLVIGAISTVLGLLLGTSLGLLGGYLRGWVDEVVMYLVDVQLSLPFVLLAVAVALVLGTSMPVLVGLAALATWPLYARVVRGEVLSLREREFVIAARASGASGLHIMRAHLLPNIIGPVLVLATLSVGRIILLESGLSFLGIGVQPPTPSWGNMINEGRELLSSEWWLATMPGMALVTLTLSVGTIGDWLRDLSDVTLR